MSAVKELLFLLATIVPFSMGQSPQRTINWWVNVGEDSTTDQANVATIKQHIPLFTQIQVNWPPGRMYTKRQPFPMAIP